MSIPKAFLIRFLNENIKDNSRIIDVSSFEHKLKSEYFQSDKIYQKRKFSVLYNEKDDIKNYEKASILMTASKYIFIIKITIICNDWYNYLLISEIINC